MNSTPHIPTEKVYEIDFDGDVFIINALSFGDAVSSWKGWMKQEYSSDYEESWEPESVTTQQYDVFFRKVTSKVQSHKARRTITRSMGRKANTLSAQ